MKHFAQINSENSAIASSWLSDTASSKNLIEIPDDFAPIGRTYDPDTGTWSEKPVVEEVETETEETLSEVESAIFDTQINTEYLACLAELNMESEV